MMYYMDIELENNIKKIVGIIENISSRNELPLIDE